MKPETKWTCDECDYKCLNAELLRAPSPFDQSDILVACPECKWVGQSVTRACDEPGCWDQASCGSPFPGGYKSHCHKHPPKATP